MESESKLEMSKNLLPVNNETEALKTETGVNNSSEEKKKATLLFLQGKRSIFIRDYQAAVVALSEACQLFSEVYSELDDALGDPYFYYGKALLEVGRSESEVLGDQIQDDDNDDSGDDDDDNDDDDEEEEEEEKEKDNGNNNSKGKILKEKLETDSNEEKNLTKDKNFLNSVEVNSDTANNKDILKEKNEESNNDKDSKNAENDEINDLQLSWEYLELAKLIYLKKAESCKETAIKLAETFLCLGENGLESENYSVAIEDIKQALELQRKHLKEEDRRIAETYYQLGVAYSLYQNYDEAIDSFKKSVEQLEKKIFSLEMRKKIGDKKTEEEEKDAFYTMDGEIKEIRAVIKDLDEKIKDMMECKNEVKAELLKQVCKEKPISSSSSTLDKTNNILPSVPTSDISHLVKKKRKNDDNDANQDKKTKIEN